MDTNEKLQALKAFHAGMGDKNYFELLGVDESADDAAIRTAYFNLLKLYGADYFHHVVDSEGRNAVDEVNAQLRKAYDTLSKKARRDAYIESLHGNGDMAQNAANSTSPYKNSKKPTESTPNPLKYPPGCSIPGSWFPKLTNPENETVLPLRKPLNVLNLPVKTCQKQIF